MYALCVTRAQSVVKILPVSHLHVIFASTSGHTEYVVNEVLKQWSDASVVRAEEATADDLQKGDVLLLAAGSWNTGGIEGQLNPYMHAFVHGPAKDAKLNGKKVLVVGLGDHRYRYTCAAADHLMQYIKDHGGEFVGPELRIVDEPYGQEAKVKSWLQTIAAALAK